MDKPNLYSSSEISKTETEETNVAENRSESSEVQVDEAVDPNEHVNIIILYI